MLLSNQTTHFKAPDDKWTWISTFIFNTVKSLTLDCTFACICKDESIVKTYNESRIYNSILNLRFLQEI